MLKLILLTLTLTHAYDPENLPKAYTEGIGAFQAPQTTAPAPAPLETPPTPLERLMTAGEHDPGYQSDILRSLMDEEPVTEESSPTSPHDMQQDWQTHQKVVELEKKEERRRERRRKRRNRRAP